ncbi:GNAT family N-acetyltransferase [Streptomyces sp. NPDC018347]|uniref:GNAT family N-acetyltransferase n=1 Tax=Streptomyces sp. NPDC018347 TaxID=3157193 RepID=UPI0033DEB61B
MGRRPVAGRELDRRRTPVAGPRPRPRPRRKARLGPPLARRHRPHMDGAPRVPARRRMGPRRRPADQHPRHRQRPHGGHRLRPRLRPRQRPPRPVPGALTHTTAPEIATAILSTPADTHIPAQPPAHIWSLGASLFWCWTGHRPVPYADSLNQLEKPAAITPPASTSGPPSGTPPASRSPSTRPTTKSAQPSPEPPKGRAQWSWGILTEEELIGLISLRRRTSSMGTISYILREDSRGHGYATLATHQVVTVAFTTAGPNRVEAMHHPDNPASGRVLVKAGFTRVGTSDRHTGDGTTVPYRTYARQKS